MSVKFFSFGEGRRGSRGWLYDVHSFRSGQSSYVLHLNCDGHLHLIYTAQVRAPTSIKERPQSSQRCLGACTGELRCCMREGWLYVAIMARPMSATTGKACTVVESQYF